MQTPRIERSGTLIFKGKWKDVQAALHRKIRIEATISALRSGGPFDGRAELQNKPECEVKL
jgi:hypothetical protein